MSGPKVVRIVTREELLAKSSAILARLDEALADWREAAGSGAADRRGELVLLLDADRFEPFNQAAQREIAFLTADAGHRRELAATARADKRLEAARVRENARFLLKSLKAMQGEGRGVVADAALAGQLEAAARGDGGGDGDSAKALNAGFRLLHQPAQARTLSAAQRELAGRLVAAEANGPGPHPEKWTQSPSAVTLDPRVESIARQLESVAPHLGDGQRAAFEQRFEQLIAMPDQQAASNRSLLLDSLCLDLVEAAKTAKTHAAWLSEARAIAGGLSAFVSEKAVEARALLDASVRGTDLQSLPAQIEAGRLLLRTLTAAAAAQSRRQAVLQGLAKLGYAVNEELETAWAEQGRVVVLKPGLEGYGVEFVGAPDANRLQVRTVALAETRDTTRDVDAEQLWCGDFSKLRNDLALEGSNVFIEKALGVGAVPLKVVKREELDEPAPTTAILLKNQARA